MRIRLAAWLILTLCALAAPASGQVIWQNAFSGVNTNLNGVAFGNGLWVAVGDAGTIVTSPDGQTWTPRASATGDRLRAVAFGSGRFVVTRENATSPALTSSDGITWDPIILTFPNGSPGSSTAWIAIAFGNGIFAAVGSGPTEVMRSSDGLHFVTAVDPGVAVIEQFQAGTAAITFDRGRFVCCGASSEIYSSADAIAWQLDNRVSYSQFSNLSAIAGDGSGRVLALGPGNSAEISPAWTPPAYWNFFAPTLRDASGGRRANSVSGCFGLGVFVFVDRSGAIFTRDRNYWSIRGRFASGNGGLSGVAFNGVDRFVAVGLAPLSQTAVIVTSASQVLANPPTYTIQFLGSGEGTVPTAINNLGQVVGNTYAGPPFITSGGATTFFALPPGAYGRVMGVSEIGTSVGLIDYESSPSDANVFPGVNYPLASIDVGNPSPIWESAFWGVSPNGLSVGEYLTQGGTRAFIFNQATSVLTDLGSLGTVAAQARAANDNGDIAGTLEDAFFSTRHAFVRNAAGVLTRIPRLSTGQYSESRAMNAGGDVVGYSNVPDQANSTGSTHYHAFLYQGGVSVDLDRHASVQSAALGINSVGQAVGLAGDNVTSLDLNPTEPGLIRLGFSSYAALWQQGEMYDLNFLIDGSGARWQLGYATAISESGQIVGVGAYDGKLQPFIATPTNNPPLIGTPLVNLSTRLLVGTGEKVGIAGFQIRGGSKKLLIRGIGPALAAFGIPGTLANPKLELHDATHVMQQNDDWQDNQAAEVTATGLAPSFPSESAIIATLPAGDYTAILRGAGDTTGVGLVELYDLEPASPGRLKNISTRADTQPGDNVVIAGFIIGGHEAKKVVIRAIGPSLANFGIVSALQDPYFQLYDRNFYRGGNDNWADDAAAAQFVGMVPPDQRESVFVAYLAPGPYTVIMAGIADTTGVGLIEVFDID